VDESALGRGSLEPINALTLDQIEDACEAAFENARALLEEADLLRAQQRCARAYYLAHIACEEIGKLPILTALAVSVWINAPIDWTRIDRALRSHETKIKQVLFMDSLHQGRSIKEQDELYEEDVKRLRAYTDLKNASLYSFLMSGRFLRPNDEMTCEAFDSLRSLAESRLTAFEAEHLQPFRGEGGMTKFFGGQHVRRANDALETLLGPEGRAAYEEYERTGDEAALRGFYDQAFPPLEPGDIKGPALLSGEELEEERRRTRDLTSRPPRAD
jgi:AbiV family abortive infection protein